MTSNNTIIEEIRAAYARDDRIPHPAEIAVGEHGGTVTLRGSLGSPHQLRAAVEIARSVRGVRKLDNELTLDPRDRWADGELRGVALQALMSSEDVPADHIEVHVANGWLTMKGEVKHQEDSDAAFAAVSGLKGIGGITNEIKVVTAGLD
ncbi:MAG TPA: BON domain-containing protein [Solirubrobacteraceae bacterium]|nr:BON domain-containing protein [Solirubrobacteraceae bacterium]